MKIKAVGFDIDGTLYPNSSMYLLSLIAFLMHPLLFYHFGKIRKKIRTFTFIDDFRRVQADLMSASLGVENDVAAEMIEHNIYGRMETVFKRIKPFSDVRPVILSLKRAGLKCAAMSDLPVGRKLEYLGVSDLMDFAFSTEETGYLKPHILPFKRLVREFKVLPQEILYVGNNYRYDIIGAKKLGLQTAHLSGKPVPNSQADITFSSFIELRDWIFAINN